MQRKQHVVAGGFSKQQQQQQAMLNIPQQIIQQCKRERSQVDACVLCLLWLTLGTATKTNQFSIISHDVI